MKKTRAEMEAKAAEWRQKYAEGTLSSRLIAKLEAIPGWDWIEGPEPDAKSEPEAWIIHMRTRHAAGTLPAWKIERLEQMPGWTWA